MKHTLAELQQRFDGMAAAAVLQESSALFADKLVFATSLGAEDQIVTHLIAKLKLPIRIITLDTGRIFPETYDLLHRTTNRYNLKIETYFPHDASVEKMVNSKGINLFYESIENRKLCCEVRKIEPLKRALSPAGAWITGLRREQSVTRTGMHVAEWDAGNGMFKINPLIDWSEEQVWAYIHENNVPYNALHDKGFPSIGCQPCTRAIEPGEDLRAGRWWWEMPDHKECGLHAPKKP